MRRNFLAGFACCALLVGCAGFSYRFYGLEGVRYDQGKMLASTGDKDDKPFSDCQPTQADAHPCVVMTRPDFFAFKLDYEDTQIKLKKAEKDLAECKGGRRGD